MRTLGDILLSVVIVAVWLLLFSLEDGLSLRNPLSWILAIISSYLFWKLTRWIYEIKPRWQVEKEKQRREESDNIHP
jgi:hypothetical protein